MQVVSREYSVSTFDDDRPCIAEVSVGETVRVSVGMGSRSPTGPIAIADATRGDVLSVYVDDVSLDSQGRMWARPGAGLLGDDLFDHLPETYFRYVPIVSASTAEFAPGVEVALMPNVGVIGVAPGHRGPESDTRFPGRHGGNLDCNLVHAGSTVYLPVYRPQARLCVGDIHARMGDGESITCGLEIGGVLDLTIGLVKDQPLSSPLILDGKGVGFVASAKTFDSAATQAFRRAVRAIERHHKLSFVEAGLLGSLIVDIRVAQIVNPRVTAVAYVFSSDIDFDVFAECLF